jgi:hypothetical protein
VGSKAGPGEVLVSSTVKDLVVGSPLSFRDHGEHELKGVPGRWRLHVATGTEAVPAIAPERALRPSDRLTLRMARRTPETMRTAAKVARRLSRSRG